MARATRCRFSSQAIMCVQLLSWCVAACLLLYRGVTTLRREPALSVTPSPALANDSNADSNDTADVSGAPTLASANLLPPPSEKSPADATRNPASKGDDVSVVYVYSHMNIPTQGAGAWDPREAAEASAGAGAGAGIGAGAGAGPGQRGAGHEGGSSLSRLRYELRPASLILIVLGFSMLLVGPVVVVLRKCDSTLNHRRGAKLPTDEEEVCDPPPSYDEATLGACGAPRYSTLFEVRDSGELVCLNAPAQQASDCGASDEDCSCGDCSCNSTCAGHKAETVACIAGTYRKA